MNDHPESGPLDLERVLVVGLGQMGGAALRRLGQQGIDAAGFDVQEDARRRLHDAGFTIAESIAAGARERTVVISSLPNDSIVREVWTGDEGIVAAMHSGSLLIEMSTISPETMRQVAASAEAAGHRVVDCAVSGGPAEVGAGTLSLMVGGAPDDIMRASAVLSALGRAVHATGGVGTAKVVKLVNNLMGMGNIAVAAEAFAVGLAAGVDARTLFDVLSVSGGSSHHFVKRFPWAIEEDYSARFKMVLGDKDVGLALDLAAAVGVPTPVAAEVRELCQLALARGYEDDDVVVLLKLCRDLARE